MKKIKIIRACTVPQSLSFVTGMIPDLQKKYEVVLLSSPGSEWEQVKSEYDGVRCLQVPMERHISIKNDIVALWCLIVVFCKEKPTMVHSMTPKAGMLCMLAAFIARVPVRVHSFTGLVFPTSHGFKRRVLMATDWLTCFCATHIVPEGEGVKDDLLNNRITRKHLKVLGFGNVKGIDLTHFSRTENVMEQAEPIRKEGITTFISIGRIVRDKGINEMVQAFQRLYTENSSVRLILVGVYEDNLDPISKDTKDIINSCKAIEAVGRQSDVRPWLAASDVAILASYREGFPNVVIEAGAMGLAQIVTNINGAREIIKDGENGVIVPSKDADALYKAMRKLTLDTELRKRLATNARQSISSRFDYRFVRKCLYDFYDEIIQQN